MVEEGVRNSLVMEKDGSICFVCLVLFTFAMGGNGGADLGEGRSEVVRGVDEDGDGVADEDADELDPSPTSDS